jgi:(p)ppGpp synthase/HD superfamily hydrolase
MSYTSKIIEHAFRDKKDKEGKPYLGHLYRVADGLPNHDPPWVRDVALLHDLLEDCPEWTAGALLALYPEHVVKAVVRLTRVPDQPYDDYIKQVSECLVAKRVKLLDLRDNMDITRLPELTEKDITRLRKYHEAFKTLSK